MLKSRGNANLPDGEIGATPILDTHRPKNNETQQ